MTTRKPKTEINHKNNDPTDNTLDNLEPVETIRPPDGAAMTIRHADETIGLWNGRALYHFGIDYAEPGADQSVTHYVASRQGQRPYVLESALVEQTLRRQRDAAQSEIEAVEADMLAIETQANNEIADIQARTDTELAARRARKDDLRRIVDMTGRALDLDPPPATNADVQDALSAAPGFPNTEKD